jgi:integrase
LRVPRRSFINAGTRTMRTSVASMSTATASPKRVLELRPRSAESLRWAFTHHLLGHFGKFLLHEITPEEIDRYKQAKLAEGDLSPNSINRTIARLSEVLELATEYGLVASNAASGKRRRLTGTRPRRPWVDVFQLPALLEAAEPLYAKRGRPLLATLAGCGLRIDEALSLERQHVNLARETLTVAASKNARGRPQRRREPGCPRRAKADCSTGSLRSRPRSSSARGQAGKTPGRMPAGCSTPRSPTRT